VDSENYKLIRNFITKDEAKLISEWVVSLEQEGYVANHHLNELSKDLNGRSFIFDISKTDVTKYITNFQSIYKVSYNILPDFINIIINRISEEFNFPKEHTFLQAVNMNKGGKITPHYDASVTGYINYKCNISIDSEDYDFFIDRKKIKIKKTDLYGFEASLYKHWTNEFNSKRIFLSLGFMVPYKTLNRTENDPRVRLSRRIEKYFQSK